MRQIAEQGDERAIGQDFRQHRGDQFVLAGRRRNVEREIERGPARMLHVGRQSPALHEGAAPDLAGNQAARFGLRIGARDGADAEAELICHVTLRQQARARLEHAGLNVAFKRLDEREIKRPFVFERAREANRLSCEICDTKRLLLVSIE